MVDASQDEHEAAFKFIGEVHNCPPVLDVSSATYKDTKYKQKEMEELSDKLGFVQTFLFLHLFLFLLFSSSVTLFQDCAKSAMLQITCAVIWREIDAWRHELANLLKFVNTSLPTYVCRVKAA